jgi:hypothetical protein
MSELYWLLRSSVREHLEQQQHTIPLKYKSLPDVFACHAGVMATLLKVIFHPGW